LAEKYVNLPLFEDAAYDYTVALEGESYTLRFLYIERMKMYTINLYDADNNPIVLGEALVPNYPIFFDYALFPLNGYFYMSEKANLLSEPYKTYPDKLDQYYNLYYIYDSGV
jgi:hypothetical protein